MKRSSRRPPSERPCDPLLRAEGAPVAHGDAARIWQELATGQWRVVAALDADGTRHVAIARSQRSPIRWDVLRRRERQVLAVAMRGASQKVIAAEIGVTASTVGEVLRAARERLGFHSIADLVRAYEAKEPPSD